MADSPRIEELKRRVQSDPASIAFAALAEEYRRAGRFDEAIETCTTGLVRHPSYLSAHVTLGRALIEVGRLPEARTELEYVLKLAPENLAAIRGLAEIHHRIGEEHVEHVEPAGMSAEPAPTVEHVESPPAPALMSRIALKIRVDDKPEVQPADVTAEAETSQAEPSAPLTVSPPEERPEPPVSTPVLTAVATHAVEEAAARAEAHVTYPRPVDPALAGLEEFLNAIIRARTQRAAAR
ncbi:MAG TPA: tetratricopeptide repeat protein [Vicinamibacterales bacterium]|nr:tetratricopeptide repeat protein [Vicinamibacterales bacterium]